MTETETKIAAQRRKRQGFTLVEMMVTIVILGLLATVVAINVLPSQDRAMVGKARADISVLEQAIETYRLDNLAFPDDRQGLQALVAAFSPTTPAKSMSNARQKDLLAAIIVRSSRNSISGEKDDDINAIDILSACSGKRFSGFSMAYSRYKLEVHGTRAIPRRNS